MAAGKQQCGEGSGTVTSELGTSPGWVQGHQHHCRMSPEVGVVLGTRWAHGQLWLQWQSHSCLHT